MALPDFTEDYLPLPYLLFPAPVMTHETHPLLPKNSDAVRLEHGVIGVQLRSENSIYDRFTPARKRMILALVSLAGMVPCEFFPSPFVALTDLFCWDF